MMLRHLTTVPFLCLAGCAATEGSVRPALAPQPHAIPSAPPAAAPAPEAAAAPEAGPAPAYAPEFGLALDPRQDLFPVDELPTLEWHRGQALLQGFFGATYFDEVSFDRGGTEDVDGDEGDLDQLPLIGGGAQWKLGGQGIDIGLEGLLSFAGRANAEAFVIGGGGAAIAIDVDMLIFEMYGGPFASVLLGETLRLYAAAGPLMQFADCEQDEFDDEGETESGSGFGTGYYARAGFELVLPSYTLIGMGARWSDST